MNNLQFDGMERLNTTKILNTIIFPFIIQDHFNNKKKSSKVTEPKTVPKEA